MFKKINIMIITTLICSSVLAGCMQTPNNTNLESHLKEKDEIIESLVIEKDNLMIENRKLEDEIRALENSTPQQSNTSQSLVSRSLDIMELIKAKNMKRLSSYIHPTKGLRFTPYFYIDTQKDQVFTSQQVATLDQNTNIFNWGVYDGKGDPISLNFNDYYDKFIYDEDFINSHLIGNNTPIGSGNTIDNIAQAYPNGEFVEFHFTGFDSQYSGIDWRSLRLIFEQENGVWYLVGIVHGQWTI